MLQTIGVLGGVLGGMLGILGMLAVLACDATETAEQCVAADLVGQCPAGSSPMLGAVASSTCGGAFNGQTIGDGVSVSGQCGANGSCEFLCQFEVPCSCGVATLTKESIVCAECADQSCGDGRCEGTERPGCGPGDEGCFPCPEDCGGATCGDGDCTSQENPTTCPEDCAGGCLPNARTCIGSRLSVCAADGRTAAEVDCALGGQLCANGQCAAPNVCGNGLCEAGEDGVCLADCERVCDPSSRTCAGLTLVVCALDGESQSETDCGAAGQICFAGECRPADVCGNGLCEAGEQDCASDCVAVCGNGRCENNEATSCARDCVVCGDDTCGAGEIESCPQDCGICVPSEKQCLGKTLRVCNANGTAYDDIDCGGLSLSCALGNCVVPDVCGNGVCELGETEASCDRDCAEVCGNGRCGGLESFDTCALDCDPVCGDGACEGDEDNAGCSFDCLSTCGNAACDGLEDRDNCPRDCGFCGDGSCQDGAESASLTPPAGQEACLADCVITECGDDGDCNDRVACTRNQCLNGSCIYPPDDGLCTGDERCIGFHGCCGDADQDGYADLACGGSDCNDDDRDVHPGSLEVCGGGDRNCNGRHRPALAPAKKLTATASTKRGLKALVSDGALTLVWSGKATIYEQMELLPVSWGLVPDGQVVVVGEVRVNANMPHIQLAYHPTKHALGAMWALHQDNGSLSENRAAWIGLDGALVGAVTQLQDFACVVGGVGYSHTAVPYGAVVQGDGVLFSTRALLGTTGNENQGGWLQLAATGNLSRIYGAACDTTVTPRSLLMLGDLVTGIVGASPGENKAPRLVTIDTSAAAPVQVAEPLSYGTTRSLCVLGDDGALLTTACVLDSKVTYNRTTQAGASFYEAEVMTGEHTPLGIGKSTPRPGDAPQVGVVTRDNGNNLWFFVRGQDGEAVLEPAIVAGGETLGEVSVMHDGNDFVLMWLAKVQGFEQVFGQRITCE